MIVETVFPCRGQHLRSDHAYSLYSAISRIIPTAHHSGSQFRFSPITGEFIGEGKLLINASSSLRIRIPDNFIRDVLPLAGRRMEIDGHSIRFGVPSVRTLIPSASLISRITTFKNAQNPEAFLETARTKLQELGISGEPQLPIHLEGSCAGETKRRIIRIKDMAIVGYSLIVSELSAEDSIRLQETGLGGRTHMGCGFFVPVKSERQ